MSVNKVILIGRLGGDPELFGEPDKIFARFSIATDRRYAKGNGGEKKVDWHSITVFGKQAQTIHQHFKKGQEIYIEGRIEYKNMNGKYYTDIILQSFSFVGKADDKPK